MSPRFTLAVLLTVAWHLAYGQSYHIPETEPPYGASAEEVKQALADCDKNQMTMTICAWHRYRESSRKLNAAVAAVRKALADDKTRLPYFNGAHRSWLAFRNADCDLDASSVHGGSMLWSIAYACRERLNSARATHLDEFAGCMAAGGCDGVPITFYK